MELLLSTQYRRQRHLNNLLYTSRKLVFHKSKPFKDWEEDMQAHFSDQQWQSAFKSIFKATCCTSLWELSHKIYLRWYLTPQKIAKFQTLTSPTCWRGCQHTGTLLHTLWFCPAITNLWTDMEHILQDIFHSPMTFKPQLAILNLNTKSVPPSWRIVTTHILLVTRLLITRYWKSQMSPTITEVITLVQLHYTHESILSRGKPSHLKTSNLWFPWEQWYTKRLN